MKRNSQSTRSTPGPRNTSSRWEWERHLQPPPPDPGVYFFLSAKGEVLYVGKANNLNRRINSYRQKALDPKTRLLLTKAKKLKWTTLKSDLEAILLEAELIRIHQPKYNLRLRDDKTPLYIRITKDQFPRVLLTRKSDLDPTILKASKRIFGPFHSAYQTKRVLKIARKAFPFCNAPPRQTRQKRACFYFHLNLCPGACIGTISEQEYSRNIRNLSLFLKGKRRKLVKALAKKMKHLAKNLNFEEAAKVRDQLEVINYFTQTHRLLDWQEGLNRNLNAKKARSLLYKTLVPFFAQTVSPVPQNPFARIEAYDVSNISGKLATAAMVVFSEGTPDPGEYRRFRIRFLDVPDDPSMLKQVLVRRLLHKEWKLPDLIIVDGGKGQVQATREALAGFGLHHKIWVVGIAKRLEHLVVKKQVFHILELPRRSPSLKLVMHIRDEAHRFAHAYHQVLHGKTLVTRGRKSGGWTPNSKNNKMKTGKLYCYQRLKITNHK